MADPRNFEIIYQQLCDSYRAIDEMRTKLLSFLPLVTGAGIAAGGVLGLTSAKAEDKTTLPVGEVLAVVGVLGVLATIGLFSLELHGIKKCASLIDAGQLLEDEMGIWGQFLRRPQSFAGFINEPFAASIIYPGSIAGWTFLALLGAPSWVAMFTAGAVFLILFVVSLLLLRQMDKDLHCRRQYGKEPNWFRPDADKSDLPRSALRDSGPLAHPPATSEGGARPDNKRGLPG